MHAIKCTTITTTQPHISVARLVILTCADDDDDEEETTAVVVVGAIADAGDDVGNDDIVLMLSIEL